MAKTNEELEREIKNLRAHFKTVIGAQQKDITRLGGHIGKIMMVLEELAENDKKIDKKFKALLKKFDD